MVKVTPTASSAAFEELKAADEKVKAVEVQFVDKDAVATKLTNDVAEKKANLHCRTTVSQEFLIVVNQSVKRIVRKCSTKVDKKKCLLILRREMH